MKKRIGSLFIILLISLPLYAQQSIKGVVTDAQGDPLSGVTVLLKGTFAGTVTDVDGAYSISVPGNEAVLVYSFIGFASQEIPVAGQREINVVLNEDMQQI